MLRIIIDESCVPCTSKHVFEHAGGLRAHLLTSLPMLVSQPLVLSRGRHVLKLLSQKHVLFVWQVPPRLHGSAPQPRLRTYRFVNFSGH